MGYVFGDYEEKDYDDLREMMYCLYEEDPEGLPITDLKIKNTIAESLARPEKIRIVMIRDEGANIGYGLLVFFWSNEYGGDVIDIDELFIKKEYRNRRIATDFIRSQISAGKTAVAVQVEATKSNSAAERLYKRLGFEQSPNTHLILRV